MALRKVAALAAVVSIAFGVAAASAAAYVAPPNNSYLCYSKFQIDPGVWSDNPIGLGGLGGNVSASALLKLGYWSPFAEKSTPTKTKLLGGWYLNCNPPGATLAGGTPSAIVGGAGEMVTNKSLAGRPGYYPLFP